MRGPAPQTNNVKMLRGNPGKRPLNMNEPKFSSGEDLPPPDILGEVGRRWYYTLGNELVNNGLLTVVDVPALAVFCREIEKYVEAEKFLAENGFSYYTQDEQGNQRWHHYPQIAVSAQAAKFIDKYASKFGFTPADRTRIRAAVTDEAANKPGDDVFS